jgi:hypothetical protein
MSNRFKKFLRAQSAMEYLMTYGWAILIIAVVLGALFSLGVFSSGALLGTACVAGPGYECLNPILGTSGNIAFTFGQNTGSPVFNVGFACAATSSASGLPNTGSPSVEPVLIDTSTLPSESNNDCLGAASAGGCTSNVLASPNSQTRNLYPALTLLTPLSLVSGQTVSITGLACFGSTGASLFTAGTNTIGTSFSGSIWMNYTPTSEPGGPGNWLTTKIATVTVKVA